MILSSISPVFEIVQVLGDSAVIVWATQEIVAILSSILKTDIVGGGCGEDMFNSGRTSPALLAVFLIYGAAHLCISIYIALLNIGSHLCTLLRFCSFAGVIALHFLF